MGLLPISDDTPRRYIDYPYVTWAIVGSCVVIFLMQLSGGDQGFERSLYSYGVIPSVLAGDMSLPPELQRVPAWLTLFTSQFLHGGWMHLIGNMLFLWIFGDNIEDSTGHVRFLVFYLLCGALAGLGFALSDPTVQAPTIGASGAIAAVLGAYIVLHPRARVLVLVGWWPVHMPAFLVLGIWILFQVLNAAYAQPDETDVAFLAHIVGFVAGVVLVFFFKRSAVPMMSDSRQSNLRIYGLPQRRPGERGPWGEA
jgi:membrane associated rhomboid family serine protease